MRNHWDKFLNLKQIILERRPRVIVECGAGDGGLTRLIAGLLDVYDFEFHVISDKVLEGIDPRICWRTGLSYEALPDFEDSSIDLCIIDTDHNYWTLMKEFAAVFNKIREGGLVAMHDVETFYHDTGMALAYWDGKPYPRAEIEKLAPYGGLGDALIEFLQLKKMHYKLLAFTPESHGAALIERRTQSIFSIIVPGPGAGFAPKKMEEQIDARIPVS